MARILYFDCFSGISGDMVLGAFLDLGLPLTELESALGSLAVSNYHVTSTKVLRAGVSATKFDLHAHGDGHGAQKPPPTGHRPGGPHVHETRTGPSQTEHGDAPAHHHAHRSLGEIFELINTSSLSATGRDRAIELFQRLGEAEAAIHHMPVAQVHLHEVGALDSIIDVVGAVFALEWANVDRVICSPLNVGGGTVDSAHGRFPVPAPATLSLLGSAPIYSGAVQQELVTPTGALIATSYASTFGPIPPVSIESVGYGAGSRDTVGTPNVLRILIGRAVDEPSGDRVSVLECEIDDMNPQIFGVLMDRLYEAGALEVFYVPVQMKKNRPGTLLTIIGPPERRDALTDLVFRETTTIGLRHMQVDRECLARDLVMVETAVGPVRFKLARRNGALVNAAPEFEDCVALAAAKNLSVKDVLAMAVQAYRASRDLSVPRS